MHTYIHSNLFERDFKFKRDTLFRILNSISPTLGWSIGDLGFSRGRSQINCTLAKLEVNAGTPLAISLWWLDSVDDELSALAVKSHSLSIQITMGKRDLNLIEGLFSRDFDVPLKEIRLYIVPFIPTAQPSVGPNVSKAQVQIYSRFREVYPFFCSSALECHILHASPHRRPTKNQTNFQVQEDFDKRDKIKHR
jgi:hypothetical protein